MGDDVKAIASIGSVLQELSGIQSLEEACVELAKQLSLLTYLSQQHLPAIVFWGMGSLQRIDAPRLLGAIPYLALGFVLIGCQTRQLDVLLMGDQRAASLGLDLNQTKLVIILAASLLTATAVSVTGIIGFVGLIVPHTARLITGPNHRVLIPFTALAGGILLILADVLARSLISPAELPVGILTSLLGGPFFLWLLRRPTLGIGLS